MGGELEVTYGMDRRGNPALLSHKESVAQQLINAIFMAPGNIPNLPIGLKVEDYLYEDVVGIQSSQVFSTLKKACGEEFMMNNIKSLDCYTVNLDGSPSFLLSAHIGAKKDEDDTMALVLTRQNETIKFNYSFLSEGVQKVFGSK